MAGDFHIAANRRHYLARKEICPLQLPVLPGRIARPVSVYNALAVLCRMEAER